MKIYWTKSNFPLKFDFESDEDRNKHSLAACEGIIIFRNPLLVIGLYMIIIHDAVNAEHFYIDCPQYYAYILCKENNMFLHKVNLFGKGSSNNIPDYLEAWHIIRGEILEKIFLLFLNCLIDSILIDQQLIVSIYISRNTACLKSMT